MTDYTLFPSILPSGEDAEREVADEIDVADAETALDADECPFCDTYDGDYPANHAPKAHPNRWRALKNAMDDGPNDAEGTADADGGVDPQTSDDHLS